MQNIRWTNQNHPQTLRIGVILLYFNAVTSLLGGPLSFAASVLVAAASVAAGVGISDDKRIAWYGGVLVAAIIPTLLLFVLWADDNSLQRLFSVNFLLTAIFPVALLAALVHPISRSYVRTWFN